MDFPSLKAPQFLAILERAPLNYSVVRQSGGSHRQLESSNGYPPLGFSWHDRMTINGGVIRRVLVDRVGLAEPDAMKAVKGRLK
jgi:hypothetical protein